MKYFSLAFQLIAFILFINSCSSNDDADLVGNVFDNTLSNVYFTDTLTVNASTVRIDSFITSGYNKIFVGNKIDEYLGKTTARSYIPLTFSSTSVSFDKGATYDSLILVLTPNGNYLGDTLVDRHLQVYEVTDSIMPFSNGYFYNNTQFSLKSEPINEVNFKFRPRAHKKVYIPFPQSLGMSWFDMIVNQDQAFNSKNDFQNLFKGIAIVPGDSADNWSASFYGLPANDDETKPNRLELRLYYSVPNVEGDQYYAFIPSDSAFIFSNFKSDRSGTVLGNKLDSTQQVKSTATDDLSFMQSGNGLAVKIDIPALQRINEISPNISILSAELIMKPIPGSYDSENPLPQSLNIFWTDKKNRIGNALYDITGQAVISATLTTDEEYKENTYYSADILNYVLVKTKQKEYTDDDLMFLVSPETFATTFSRVALMDQILNQGSMQLKLYYLIY